MYLKCFGRRDYLLESKSEIATCCKARDEKKEALLFGEGEWRMERVTGIEPA
jgi:hypothetical protein